MKTASPNIPTILVIFGATGDLMNRKIIPALFHLFTKGELPNLFQVIGFSRRGLSQEQFRKYLSQIIKKQQIGKVKQAKLDLFVKLFSYYQGRFEQKVDYQNLGKTLGQTDQDWQVCANKLFYIAAPPKVYEIIFRNLADSGLTKPCSPGEGWTRIIVEKPFGKDQKTARKLDGLFKQLFKEEQIYRIDHYLAKEMLQNILSFRFANSIFEKTWNNQAIEYMEIRLLETVGVEKRVNFYDGLGALRDVGQNHLLQMLALATMENPGEFTAESIRQKRAAILQTLRIPSPAEIRKTIYRAQYQGYLNIKGVNKTSTTETYFKVAAFLDHPRWLGVPIILESGKKLDKQLKEIVVTFKHAIPCLCPPGENRHFKNKLIIRLEPKEEIKVIFWAKKPGFDFTIQEQQLGFSLRGKKRKTQYVEEYEKLLLDCIRGDQTLFVSNEEVKSMWRFIDPILKSWKKEIIPLKTYKPGTNEPEIESEFIVESKLPKINLKKEIGIIGLGKMGAGIARHLIEEGWRVVGYNRTGKVTKELEKEGLDGVYSLAGLTRKLTTPRLIWLMVPAGKAVDEILFGKDGLAVYLDKEDIVVDGGNSFYKDSVRQGKRLAKQGIKFVDVGFSGGPAGARNGGSLMVGGKRKLYEHLLPLYLALSMPGGVEFFAGTGAGHFVKMIHNGIEYGMMQAIAEGFTILKQTKYTLKLNAIARVYNHGSVIESRLIGWLKDAFEIYGEELEGVSGTVRHTGEGEWAVKTAKQIGVKAKIIEEALKFRIESEKKQNYTGRILSALRKQFGGHSVEVKHGY